jgi:hypothetical protein
MAAMLGVSGKLALFALVLAVCGCGKQARESGAGAPAAMLAISAPGAALAYEHDVDIALPGQDIQARVDAVQASCLSGKFGACNVLGMRREGGDRPMGRIELRIVPKGVEPIIAQAAQGADIGSRNTRADDLAERVARNDLTRSRLTKEHQRLLEFQERKDLAVTDLIALSKQLSEIEAGMEATEREAAQHARRIDTQLVTLTFRPPGGQQGRGEITESVRDFGTVLAASIAWMIRALAALLPVAVVLWVVVFLWRRRRRRKAGGVH